MFTCFLQCALMLALMVGCGDGRKNIAGPVQVGEPAEKLVVTKKKAPTSPVQVVPVDVLPVANQFGVLARFSVKAENFRDMNLRFGGTTSVRGAGLTTVIRDVEHPERTTEWPNREFFVGGSGQYDVQVQGIANHPGDVQITMDADIRYNNGWRHTFKVVSIVVVQEETAAPVPSAQPSVAVAGNIKVQRNTLYPDRTQLNPNGVVGSKGIFLGSFIMTSGSIGGDDVTSITLADDVLAGALGQGFYNLRLMSGGPADRSLNYSVNTQIGQVVGTLGQSHEFYDFVPLPAIKLDAGDKIVVNVYADTWSSGNFDLINSDEDGVIYPSAVSGIGRQTGELVGGSMNLGLQRVFIAEHGSADVAIGPYSAIEPPHTLKPRVWTKILKIRVEAGHGEDIIFPTVSLGIRMRDAGGHLIYNTEGISGFRLVSDGVVIGAGNAPSGFDGLRRLDLSGIITLYPNSPVIVPAGSRWEGDIEIGIDELAVPGHTIQLCLDSNLAKDAAFDLLPLGEVRGATSSARIIPTVFGHDEWFVVGPEFVAVSQEEGGLFRVSGTSTIYVKSDGLFRPFADDYVFMALGYHFDDIQQVPSSVIGKELVGDTITDTSVHPNGTLIKYVRSSIIYLLEGGQKRAFSSFGSMQEKRYDQHPVITIPSGEVYPDGPTM